MSARSIVRNLRDSGTLDRPRERSGLLGNTVLVLAALAIGAGAVLGISNALPLLGESTQVPPVVVNFARPGSAG